LSRRLLRRDPGQGSSTPGADLDADAKSYAAYLQQTFEGVTPLARGGEPLTGRLTAGAFGSGRIVVVEGGAHEIHRKAGRSDATSETFSLLVNVAGSAEILHDEHSALLEPGALSFVDGSQATALNLPAHYRQIIVEFPRDMICRRYPALIRNVSARLDADDANTSLFVQMSSATAARLPLLTHDARNHVFDAMAALLGALPCTASSRSTSERRLARAMADIDARLSDPELCPAALAGLQGISRRQLDNIFAEHGLSVERVIWDRRVDRAAGEITATTKSARRLLDIALTWGFSSEAHFSRRFRLRFGCAPSEYPRLAANPTGSSQRRR
jgi:AraC family transcriptional activator of tynA and feaB